MIKRDFLLLFVFSMLIRLALFLVIYSQPIKFYGNSDAYNYEQIALNLIQSGSFSGDIQPPLSPNLYRTPVYPLFIAGIYTLTNKSAFAVILSQIFVGSIVSALMPILASCLNLSRQVGRIGGLLLAAEPLITLTTFLMLSETVFICLLVLATIMLALYFQKRKIYWLAGSAVIFALTSLTRPISQYLMFALIPLFFIDPRGTPLRSAWKKILLFLVIDLAITYSWAYRNYHEANIWTLSASGEKNLIYYRARSVLAEGKSISEQEAAAELVHYIQAEVKAHNLTSAQEIRLMRAKAIEIFRQYPLATLKAHAQGFIEVLANPGLNLFCTLLDSGEVQLDDAKNIVGCMSDSEGDLMTRAKAKFDKMNWLEKLVSFLEIALLAGMYFGTALATWKLVQSRQWYLLYFLCILIAYFPILSAGGGTGARFRIPSVPFLAIMAGIGFSRFYLLTKKDHGKQLSGPQLR